MAITAYNEATDRATMLDRCIGVPASLFAAVVATGVFATISANPAIGWRILAGIVSLAAAVLAALQTFLRLAERSEQYRETARSYGAYRRSLEQALLFIPSDRTSAYNLVNELRSALAEIAQGKPNVPPSIWKGAQDS